MGTVRVSPLVRWSKDMDAQMTVLREERQVLIDAVVARLEAIDERLSAVETRVGKIETLLASVDKKLKVV